MKLSVIIVNYNVRYFLQTCLQSVLKASEGLDMEVIVVDNASADDSIDMLKADFPSVRLLVNMENVGFSKANNQGMAVSRGKYVLLLNPDTIVPEDCFQSCIEYMESHSDVGGLGVKMIDGSGNFLPESKRGLPTPAVAFYKIFGFSSLFPKSRTFGKYHLGYLGDEEINDIEVLSGAFMFLRKSLLDEIGGLDESFFMYGEDIDLSYRITKAGFRNVYFPETQIIHFKGESTKKSSVNYVLVFYRAMIIFAKKHFEQGNARAFSALINLAIYFRAALAISRRAFEKVLLPLMDAMLLFGGTELITAWYERGFHHSIGYYPDEIHITVIPLMILLWILAQYLNGAYQQPIKMQRVFRGLITGVILVFSAYAMLDESMRFSRAVVAFSVLWAFLALPSVRLILRKWGLIRLQRFTEVNTAIIGLPKNIIKVRELLTKSAEKRKNLIYINPLRRSQTSDENSVTYQASLYQLKDSFLVYGLDEVIFCLGDIPTKTVIGTMQNKLLRGKNIFLQPAQGDFLLKSSSIHSLGELIRSQSEYQMSSWSTRRKRLLDVGLSLLMMVSFPFVAIMLRRPGRYLSNMLGILIGEHTFVGSKSLIGHNSYLIDLVKNEDLQVAEIREKKRHDYALQYSLIRDMEIIFANLSSMDRDPLTN